MDRQVFRHQLNSLHRWQGHQRRQGRTEIMCRQTKLAGVGWQAILVARRMLDGVRPRRQLCEEEDGNEKEAAHLKHRVSLAGQHYAWMALGSSVAWGTADFFGGLLSGRRPAIAVVGLSSAIAAG